MPIKKVKDTSSSIKRPANESINNRNFQSHLKKIVSIPILFIILLLLFFHGQNYFKDESRSHIRTLENIEMLTLRLEKIYSDMATGLHGYIFSRNPEFLTSIQIDDKIASIQKTCDEVFDKIGSDAELHLKFTEILDDFGRFKNLFQGITDSMAAKTPFTEAQAQAVLLTHKELMNDVNKKLRAFLNQVEEKKSHERAQLDQISDVAILIEALFATILVFFIIYIMTRQINQLTKGYQVLMKRNRRALQDAEANATAKDHFLVNMSHEIRTPLGAIVGFSDLLNEKPYFDLEARHHIAYIKRNSEHLLGLINDLFDLTRLSTEKLDIFKEKVNLGELIEDIANDFRSKIDDKQMQFKIHFETPIPTIIESDTIRLRQIITNIVGNAIKFSPEKSSVTLIFSYIKKKLQIDVIDQGIGIDLKAQEHIFESFNQADQKYSRKYGGAGLGLSISRKLAQLLEGDLFLVSSKPRVGSHFRAIIPCASLSKQYMDRLQSEPGFDDANRIEAKIKSFDFSGKKILLAEDSRENQVLFKIFINSTSANLSIVDNGIEAVRHAHENEYDLIILDIQMPGLDGYEVVKILRGSLFEGKIIALTAHTTKGEREKCVNSGFDEYLSKPVTQVKLLQTIEKVLG